MMYSLVETKEKLSKRSVKILVKAKIQVSHLTDPKV